MKEKEILNKSNTIKIFTDGASKGNPGPGGWGAVILSRDFVMELGGREEETTNNRMELRAILEALRKTHSITHSRGAGEGAQNLPNSRGAGEGEVSTIITIYTDSSYAMNGATKWINGWKKNGWLTKEKKEVLNRDLWEEINRVMEGQKIKWEVIGGHVGIPGNERADEVASDFGNNKIPELFVGKLSDYKVDVLNIDLNADQKEKKTEKKARSKMKAFSYLSFVDGKLKKHATWNECEERVRGKKAVKYRKAVSAEDEREILKEWGIEE